jgi:hypothetical protein
MIEIPVTEHALERLQRAADSQGTEIWRLLDQIVEQYVVDESLLVIDREQAEFEANHAVLSSLYAGEYVAMRRGQVVDHDTDRASLGRRVRARYGSESVLIAPVLREARQTITIHSPHLEGRRP